ncbi:MAG TPA: hypothetical protein VIV58_39330, partial [Kofleriaceae bacterium]
LLALALAACSTNSVSLPLVAPGEPELVAYASGYGPWRAIDGRFDGDTTTYQLELDGDYALALVCLEPGGAFHATEVFGTLDDAEITLGSWQLPDCRPPGEASAGGPAVEVEAQILDASHVALDGGAARIAPSLPWVLDTAVAPGTHDVILWGDSAMRIVRDVPFVASSNDLGVLAVAEASSLLVARSYDAGAIGDEMAAARFQLTTANGTVMRYSSSPDAAYFPPASLLRPGDTEQFELIAYDVSGVRGAIETNFPETPPDVDLLPQIQLPYVPADSVRLHWQPFGAFFTSATIEYSNELGTQSASASKLWLERHAGTDIVFDEVDVPHYDPSWHVTLPAAKFTVERWSPDEILFTSTPQISL